jgi:biotin transport system substrate-specific component
LLRPLDLITTSTFSVLTAIGSLVFFPLYPVPLTLQTLFTYLAGAVLGPSFGALSQVIYILLGGIGLPVFAGGKAGFGTLLGPTGGYLFGFVAASLAIGKFSDLHTQPSARRIAASFVLGTAIIYGFGVAQLSQWMNGDIQHALAVGVLPFIVGDALKIAVATAVAARLRHILPRTGIRRRGIDVSGSK